MKAQKCPTIPGVNISVRLAVIWLAVIVARFSCNGLSPHLLRFEGEQRATAAAKSSRTLDHPIIDSAMNEQEAFAGIDRKCPERIRKTQKLVTVLYYSFDRKIHRGQLIVDRDLESDVRSVFKIAIKLRFPICSVIPVSNHRFLRHNRWDDRLSMAENNSSAFNYRRVAGSAKLSSHAYGRAIDINPVQNPDMAASRTGRYNPSARGTLTAHNPITQAFLQRGWKWGGLWRKHRDYQHFEKPVKH